MTAQSHTMKEIRLAIPKPMSKPSGMTTSVVVPYSL